MRILITILTFFYFSASAQIAIPFANGRSTDTAETPGALRADGIVRFNNYKGSDTNRVFGIDANGILTLRVKSNGSGSTTDTSHLSARIDSVAGAMQPLLGYTPENAANKVTSFASPNNTTYPTTAAVNTQFGVIYTAITDSVQGRVKYSDTTTFIATWAHINLLLGSYVLTSTLTSNYVPYSGATSDVNLGSHTIVAGNLSGTNTGDQTISDVTITTTDITTNNATTSKHGFLKKLDNNAAHFLDGTGSWSAITGFQTYSDTSSAWGLTLSHLNTILSAYATLVSPSFTTPSLGVATAASINKISFPAPATSATITATDGKAFTFLNTMLLAGTDGATYTLPGSSATLARRDGANTFTGVQTHSVNPIYSWATTANGLIYTTGGTGGVLQTTSTTPTTVQLSAAQLADYEPTTNYTPTVSAVFVATAQPTFTTSRYWRIGKHVYVQLATTGGVSSSAAAWTIGLPYTPDIDQSGGIISIQGNSGINVSNGKVSTSCSCLTVYSSTLDQAWATSGVKNILRTTIDYWMQ